MLDERRLRELLAGEAFVARLEVADVVGSTNARVRELALAGAPSGTVVVAGEQSAGRGRQGRTWHSPPGLGLYISVLLRPAGTPALATRWTLGAAVAACRACHEVGARGTEIEWPNDLVHRRRKLGGCLAELRGSVGGSELVLGTGINVGQAPDGFPAELRERATSLRCCCDGGSAPDRETLAAAYVRELARVAEELAGDGWERIARDWLGLAPRATGWRVRVARPGREQRGFDGVTRGIDELGALVVERAGGGRERVHLADAVTWED